MWMAPESGPGREREEAAKGNNAVGVGGRGREGGRQASSIRTSTVGWRGTESRSMYYGGDLAARKITKPMRHEIRRGGIMDLQKVQ